MDEVTGDTLGARVRSARHRAELTQESLAEAAKIAVRTVRAIEGDRMVPTVPIAARIAQAVDVDLDELVPEWMYLEKPE